MSIKEVNAMLHAARYITKIVALLAVLLSLLVPYSPAQAAPWWDASWSYRRVLSFDATDVNIDVTPTQNATTKVIDTVTYDAFGFLAATQADTLEYYVTEGSAHSGDRKIIVKYPYTISTQTWGARVVVYDDADPTIGVGGELGGGVIGTNIFVFFTRTYWSTGTGVPPICTGYVKSTDLTGTVWGAFQPTALGGGQNLNGGFYGSIIANSDNSAYAIATMFQRVPNSVWTPIDEINGTLKTTDNGVTWVPNTDIAVYGDEIALTSIGDNKIIALKRHLTGASGTLLQYTSSDFGTTWSENKTVNIATPVGGTKVPWITYDPITGDVIAIYANRRVAVGGDNSLELSRGNAEQVYADATRWGTVVTLKATNVSSGYPTMAKVGTNTYYYVWSSDSAAADADTWGGYYTYPVAENLVNFPVLVTVSAANGFDLSQFKSGGVDFVAIDKDGSTRLPCEPEGDWVDGVGGHFWVSVPQIDANANYTDYMYVYWGNAGAVTASYTPTAVWDSNYVLVNHMMDTIGNNSTLPDSTINSINGSKGDVAKPLQVAGKIGYGQEFDYLIYQISFGTNALLNLSGNFTLEYWWYCTNFGAVQNIVRKYTDATNRYGTEMTAAGYDQPHVSSYFFNTALSSVGIWRKDTIRFVAGASLGAYSDGNLIREDTAGIPASSGNTSASALYIGSSLGGNNALSGIFDEFRVSSSARSNQWIKATNLSETDQLIYYGGTDCAPTMTTNAATGVTMNKDGVTGGTFSGNITDLGGVPFADISFQYGLTGFVSTYETTAQSVNTTGQYTASMPTTLTPGATYQYRAKGVNVDGTGYGANVTFTFTMPTVVTGTATQAGNTITLQGNVATAGVASSSYVYFQYGTTAGLGSTTALVTQSGTGAYSATITAPASDTTLYYRAVAQNGVVITTGSIQTQAVPSAVGAMILRLLLRVILAGVIVTGVAIVGSQAGSKAMLLAAIIGLLAFIIVDTMINALF